MNQTEIVRGVIVLYLLVAIGMMGFAQEEEVKSIVMDDYIYNNNIKTVKLHKDGWELAPSFIELNSLDKLRLDFDELDDEVKDYRFTVIHCDAAWKKSDMSKMDYLDGFEEDMIEDYYFSYNTLQKYIHYSFSFPTDDIVITKSGNYILVVYDESIENVVLSRRFYVYESLVTVEGRISKATAIKDMNYKQQIDFSIFHNNYQIVNPYKDVKICITQNNRFDNAILNMKPRMVKNEELDYNYDYDNVFSGGNEFRHINCKSLRNYSERTKRIIRERDGFHYFIKNDEIESYLLYKSNRDINGRFLVKTEESEDSRIESEYVYVHLTMTHKTYLPNGDFYVLGELSDWRFSEGNKMKYNFDTNVYEITMYLKQGYYNYQYVFLKKGEEVADESFVEGKHYETENDYYIYVYHQQVGEFYDRLIALKKMNSLGEK